MSHLESDQKKTTQRVIYRPDALKNYNQRQQEDVWPHLNLPGYLPYLWLLLGLLFLATLLIAMHINSVLAATPML